MPIRTVLCPTDFSEPAKHAYSMACSLARDYQAQMVVLHVYTPPAENWGYPVAPPASGGQHSELEAQMRGLHPTPSNPEVEYRVLEGDPATQILAAAAACHASLIVMGTHGRTGIGRLLMGSVSEQVLRKSKCPVLVSSASAQDAFAPASQCESAYVATK